MRSEAVVDVEQDDLSEYVIEKISTGNDDQYISLFKELTPDNDPFEFKPEDMKKISGISPELKRKVSRSANKANDAHTKSVDPTLVYSNGYSIFNVVLPPYNLDYLAKLYEISAPHYAAVNAKTANIVGLGYSFVNSPQSQNVLDDIEGDAAKLKKVRRKIERYKQDLDSWLDSTNPIDTFLEVLKKVWIDYESTGNAYIEIGRTSEGHIGYIGHIPSITMRIRAKRDGFVQIVGKTATFFKNYGDQRKGNPVSSDKNPNEIIHLKNYTPGNTFYGIPDIISAKNSLAGAEYADRYNLDYFEFKAVPRYVITLKGAKLSSGAEQQMLSFFRTGLKGKNHRTLYIPLPKDDNVEFKMEAIETGSQDSSFVKYRKQTIDDILMAHRVPITKISIGDSTVAATADADKTFKEQVCQPAQNILEKKLNALVMEVTDALLISLNELTLTDANTQSQIDQRYVMAQILTPNEVRESKGKAGLPGGDKVVETKPAQGGTNTKGANPPAPNALSRAQERQNNQSDNQAQGRNPKGAGRKVK